MTLEDLIAMWDTDSDIDSDHLDRVSVTNNKLHGKYLRILMDAKGKLLSLQNSYNLLRQKKFRYYRGECTQAELLENGWPQWQGIKPLKNEMEEWLAGDADLNRLTLKMNYVKLMIETTESIMGQIKARDWQVKNAIAFKVFLAGG